MKNRPLVSILISYYNDKIFLKECIESILAQTYTNFELILLDHASTDETPAIAQSFIDSRIKHIFLDLNAGAGGSIVFTKLLKEAQGDYIKPLSADDLLLPNAIAEMVQYLEQNPQKEILFTNVDFIDENSQKLNTSWADEHPEFRNDITSLELLKLYYEGKSKLTTPSVFMRKKISGYIKHDRSMKPMCDMLWWTSLLIQEVKFGILDNSLILYRIHPQQSSSKNNLASINQHSFYDGIVFYDIFYEIKDYDRIKGLIGEDSPLIKQINGQEDSELFPFIVAYTNLHSHIFSKKINGYLKLHDILENEEFEQKLYKKFGFSVATLRHLLSSIPQTPNLKLSQLFLLSARKIFHVCVFYMRDKMKLAKNKRYTIPQ